MKKLIFIALLLGMFGCGTHPSKIPCEKKVVGNNCELTIYHYKSFDFYQFSGVNSNSVYLSTLDEYIVNNNINPDDILSMDQTKSSERIHFVSMITKKPHEKNN